MSCRAIAIVLATVLLGAVAVQLVRSRTRLGTSPPRLAEGVHVQPTLSQPPACTAGCREDFTTLTFLQPPAWQRDLADGASRFSDNGSFFHERNPVFVPPNGYRISAPFGQEKFLTLEAYSRTVKDPQQLFRVVEDPANPANHALQLTSLEHTDGVILRTTEALGDYYQICARVGYLNFGTGDGRNGYRGGERNEPWVQGNGDATNENGCYLAAIYRSVPQPHNNIFAHHQRIAFIDTDNNTEGWTAIWDAATRRFFKSGWHPIMMAAVDGRGEESDENGSPLITYAAGGWNHPGELLAVDAYEENAWYTVCVTRRGNTFTMRIAGRFRYGGETAYEATTPDASALSHYGDPHYWALGDPHINYYEGSMLVDDVTLKLGNDEKTSSSN